LVTKTLIIVTHIYIYLVDIITRGVVMLRKNLFGFVLLAGLFLCSAGMASAHFTMVFPSDSEDTVWDVAPEDYIAELGDTKAVYMMWGHPYEHILFDMAEVPEVSVMKPDGTVEQLVAEEITVEGQDEDGNAGTFVAYKISFTVDQMGDSVVFVKYVDPEEDLVDCTKAVIHCGEEMWVGWDAEVGQETEILPYMRPYGMEEGFVFAGQAKYEGEMLAGAPVEIEIYHTLDLGIEIVEIAEEMFPYDAPMVFTRLTKSNGNGEFVYTLDEPGIWFVGATMEPETGSAVRGVFIIPVLESFPPVESSSSAELQQAVAEAKQAAEEAKAASENVPSSASAPGFEAVLAVTGILAALFVASRRK
jgi:cobalt/nickel transport protein